MDLERNVVHKLGKRGNQSFYTISNSDKKKWSIPSSELRIGFEIYEPSGNKGVLLKKYSALLHFPVIRKFLKVTRDNLALSEFVQNCIEDTFGKDYHFSIFYGTPSTDQKMTIQIINNKRILGYCKVGYTPRVGQLFKQEYDKLKKINELGVRYVPEPLLYKRANDMHVFIQSTEKNDQSTVLHEYTKRHDIFLDELYQKTKSKISFENTDYFNLLVQLRENIYNLELYQQNVVQEILDHVFNKYKNCELDWGVVHGDFTPWNTCCVNDNLFVFDFEYSLENAPKEIDYWHFNIQKSIYEEKRNINEVSSEICVLLNDNKLDICGLYGYFIFIISLYLQRGKNDDFLIIKERIDILSEVMQKIRGEY